MKVEPNKIIRSDRKTLSISVNKNGEVVVKSPKFLPESEIYRFIEEKQDWILSKLKKVDSLNQEFSEIIKYQKMLLFGKKYSVFRSNSVKKISFVEDKFLINANIEDAAILKKIKNWYKLTAKKYVLERLVFIANKISYKFTQAKISDTRGRWGACTSDRTIFLNWRLIMLPEYLIDYVIVHELCHTIEMNHSSKFWQLVEIILPRYKELRRILKNYSFLLKLY